MQIKSLRVADTASEQASARLKKLKRFDRLKAQGCSVTLSLQAIAWSKAALLPLVETLSETRDSRAGSAQLPPAWQRQAFSRMTKRSISARYRVRLRWYS